MSNITPLLQKSQLQLRGKKNSVDPARPYAWLHEMEPNSCLQLESYATIFLTNRECPFRCLMCDLWKNTTDRQVALGAIPGQIQYALERLPPARNIKLYNSGNFFDPQAIPRGDWQSIARMVEPFHRLVVENHPRFTDRRCLEFQQIISPKLEVAIGLETIHPQILRSLNKQMSLGDFSQAVASLRAADMDVRAFVLLKPPGLEEQAAIEWAVKSIEYAFECGVQICSLIPVRAGNGAVDDLLARGLYREPSLDSLENALKRSLQLNRGRVYVDLWDISNRKRCPHCHKRRIERLHRMNDTQALLAPISCKECQTA